MFTVQTYFVAQGRKIRKHLNHHFIVIILTIIFQLWLHGYVFGVQLNVNFERAYIDIALRNIVTVQKYTSSILSKSFYGLYFLLDNTLASSESSTCLRRVC